jgi:hypothetical protein
MYTLDTDAAFSGINPALRASICSIELLSQCCFCISQTLSPAQAKAALLDAPTQSITWDLDQIKELPTMKVRVLGRPLQRMLFRC